MKVLYATGNDSKVYNMKRRLKGLPIEIVTPKDLGIKVQIIEDGNNAIENAKKKALAYYQKTKIPTIAGDSGLYINNIAKEKQPGLFVRRVNGKELTDNEMIEYYQKLVEEVGGKSIAYYVTGLAIVTEKGIETSEIKEDEFILTSKVSENIKHNGNPLDIISVDPICNKYYTEMTDKDFAYLGQTFDKKCVEFIVTNLINKP
ncbi:MAG: hypothetical protein IJO33_04250 [Bacilli bacterium]|nr:hypothetical protein [Bacilli bacterium]